MLKFKKTYKIIGLCLSMCLAMNGLFVGATAQVSEETYDITALSNIDNIISGGSINVNGQENELYMQFSSQSSAIEDIKNEVPSILQSIATVYDLSPLNESNWNDYRDSMLALLDSDEKPSNYSESNEDLIKLRSFFDIYENADKNDEILEYVDTVTRTRSAIDTDKLALMLPCDTPIVQDFMSESHFPMSRAPIFVDDAVEYATAHATNRNTDDYDSFLSGDCANFVSQILENAGVNQVVYDSEYSGWWHKKTTTLWLFTTHKHSRSWTVADTFTRYMGVKYSTTSHYNFSANLSKGSIIALDETNDGDWDHMGFVTDRKTSVGNVGYYNYKVAQHTSDYHEWANTSKCGWDAQPSGCKYARVRA